MIAFFHKISHVFFLSNRAMMDVTMRRKCPSTPPSTADLSIDLQLAMTLSRRFTAEFSVICVPTAPCETVYLQNTNQWVKSGTGPKQASKWSKTHRWSTTAGSSVEGGWCGHRWIRNDFKTIMSVIALPSRASARRLRSIVWIIWGQKWTLSPSEICINSPNLSWITSA